MQTHSEAVDNASPTPTPAEMTTVRLDLVSKLCSADNCPTIYRTDRGTLVVQGYAINATEAGLTLPQGELLVEIPLDLLRHAAEVVH
jgi:hypothetical protein